MRFTIVILSALFCLNATAESSIDGRSDDAIIAAAEQLIAEGEATKPEEKAAEKTAESEVIPANAKTVQLPESEIPVIYDTKKEAKSEKSVVWQLVASLGLLIVVAGSLVYASKKWGRKADKVSNGARIEVMQQHHLGPKRSIALIRVAGETMLVGITEQNINMIKAVTLIDEELETKFAQDFHGFLEDDFSIEDVRNALGPKA